MNKICVSSASAQYITFLRRVLAMEGRSAMTHKTHPVPSPCFPQVVIDAFRLINPQMILMGQEPRQTTSNIGFLNKPSIQARIHGLNTHYYSISINYRKNELEQKMLQNLHKKVRVLQFWGVFFAGFFALFFIQKC